MGFHHLYSHRGCNQRCNLALHNNPTNLHLLLINPDGLIPTRHKNLQDCDISFHIICQNNFWNQVSSNLLRTPNYIYNKSNFTLNSNNGILAKHLIDVYDYCALSLSFYISLQCWNHIIHCSNVCKWANDSATANLKGSFSESTMNLFRMVVA